MADAPAPKPNRDSITHGIKTFTDTSTGISYTYDGKPVDPPPAFVVGSYADLQRAGAAVATGSGDFADGVAVDPNTADQIAAGEETNANAAAKGKVSPDASDRPDHTGDAVTTTGSLKAGKSDKG